MKALSILILFIFSAFGAQAQELDVTVKVATPKLHTADPKVFKTLEQSVEDFMNGQKWTEDYFESQERIKCSFQITISDEMGNNTFKADLAIKASRPIFNSTQETVLFSHLDEIVFTYQEFQPIQYTKNSYIDELSQVLSFYTYIILGLDYDSFSKEGGTVFFQEAGNIAETSPRDVGGWNPLEKNNRFQIFESITNPKSIPYRKAMYNYHRKGLDVMSANPEKGREVIMSSLETLEQVNTDFLNSFILQIFANSKTTELVEIFKAAPPSQKNKFITIMSKIDPTKARKYRAVNARR